jgi:hypothetical protein
MAIASLVLGIVSLMGAAVLIIPTVLAIVLGHVSLSRIRKDPRLTGSGVAIAGFVLGYVSIIFGIIVAGLLAAMAIPAFEKVREQSVQKMMVNDARQIGAAAQQLMLETGEKRISFEIDPATGAVSGPLGEVLKQISKGTREVDGVIENSEDTFSLQHPRAFRGEPVVFDLNGVQQ